MEIWECGTYICWGMYLWHVFNELATCVAYYLHNLMYLNVILFCATHTRAYTHTHTRTAGAAHKHYDVSIWNGNRFAGCSRKLQSFYVSHYQHHQQKQQQEQQWRGVNNRGISWGTNTQPHCYVCVWECGMCPGMCLAMPLLPLLLCLFMFHSYFFYASPHSGVSLTATITLPTVCLCVCELYICLDIHIYSHVKHSHFCLRLCKRYISRYIYTITS